MATDCYHCITDYQLLPMPNRVYLAIDLGAESGRVMAGLWNGKTIRLEEVHRFPNGPV